MSKIETWRKGEGEEEENETKSAFLKANLGVSRRVAALRKHVAALTEPQRGG